MGLDMYLYRKTYISNQEWVKPEARSEVAVKTGGMINSNIIPDRIRWIVEEIGYWRKANHIHKWFVDNVQKGKDDCGIYHVSKDQLEHLLSICKAVKDDPMSAESLLPTTSGFFFGDTTYGRFYFEDIDATIRVIEECLASKTPSDFEYSSSW